MLSLRLRLRTQPTANAPVVATATNGEKLIVLEDRGAWVRVQDDDGMTGWAERNSLERTSERERRLARYETIRKLPALNAIVSARTPLYAGPGIFYPIIGELPAETQVKVYTRDHDFYAHRSRQPDRVRGRRCDRRQLRRNAPGRSAHRHDRDRHRARRRPPLRRRKPQRSRRPKPAPAEVHVATDNGGVYSAVPAGGTQPEETDRVVPRYPMMARRAGIQGPVVVRGIVRRDGTIDNVEVIQRSPVRPRRSGARRGQPVAFPPGHVRGEPIDVYYTVTVNFRLQ